MNKIINPFSEESRQILKEGYKPPAETISNFKFESELDDQEYVYFVHAIILALNAMERKQVTAIMSALTELISKRVEAFQLEEIMSSFFGTLCTKIKISECTKVPREDLYKMKTFPEENILYTLPWYLVFSSLGKIGLDQLYMADGIAYLKESQVRSIVKIWITKSIENRSKEIFNKNEGKKLTLNDIPKEVKLLAYRLLEIVPMTKIEETVNVPTKLMTENFPPCITNCLSGVSEGGRNYAITNVLTAFLSHAYIIGDSLEGYQDVLINEIYPIILGSGEKCTPPLWETNPTEKANVWYHLGFGMTTKPESFGKSKWYSVPSCQKIKNACPICQPNDFCRKRFIKVLRKEDLNIPTSKINPDMYAKLQNAGIIEIQDGVGNPLSYYIRRKYEKE